MKDGVQPSEEHVKAITNFPEPDSVQLHLTVCRDGGPILGVSSCTLVRLARPLNNHLEDDASKLKAHKVVLS